MPAETPYILRLGEIRLERFKAAYTPKKPIELHNLNAIIGRNGAGKSTVVEALQWVDTALRLDILRASQRFNGIHNLINYGVGPRSKRFLIQMTWVCHDYPSLSVDYKLEIGQRYDNPYVYGEDLTARDGNNEYQLIKTIDKQLRLAAVGGQSEYTPFFYGEDLLLSTLMRRDNKSPQDLILRSLRDFWANTIFLRLSPNEMARSVPSVVGSRDSILNETGSSLPNLLKAFDSGQRLELMRIIKLMLPDFEEVEVSRPVAPQGSIFYSLVESLPSRGHKVKKKVSIPSWMLSEGTRRITALIAVLLNNPKPSLLCVEELENGLDPWSVVTVLNELKHWSGQGVQVVFTTHSPWLLDQVRYEDIIKVERQGGETVYNRFADLDSVKFYKDQVPPGAVYASGE